MPEAIYTAENCRIAYQLHWSLTIFGNQAIPPEDSWRGQLSKAVEADGVRLLESVCDVDDAQLLLSTRPDVAPSAAVRSVKGRWQYLLRDSIPQLWKRNYSIVSVGDADNETLQSYVAGQVAHHPQADSRVVERLTESQFHDPGIDLNTARMSAHGRFNHNLHIVIENKDRLLDVREVWLQATRQMAIAVCAKKGWQLSRMGIVGNHFHILVGCDVNETPRNVALSLMNNLATRTG